MTNAKVTVTKEVAEAIELSVKNGIGVRSMLRHNVHGDLYGVYAPLQTIGVDDLAKALLIGYEVEKSPEDLLLREFKAINGACTPRTEFGRNAIERRKGFLTALDILGISIEGVSA